MRFLERLFLGKEAVEKLDAARERLKETDQIEREAVEAEVQQRAVLHDLARQVKEDARRLRSRPPARLRQITIPDFDSEK